MASDIVRLARVRALLDTGAARAIRTAHGIPLAAFADQVGVSDAALSRWETGSRRPRRETALRYLDCLEQLTGRAQRAVVLAAACAADPERFVHVMPQPPSLPTAVWINPPQQDVPMLGN